MAHQPQVVGLPEPSREWTQCIVVDRSPDIVQLDSILIHRHDAVLLRGAASEAGELQGGSYQGETIRPVFQDALPCASFPRPIGPRLW